MGQEISRSSFSAADHAEFRQRLRDETATLMQWFAAGNFQNLEQFTVGLELEAWLVDENHLPDPRNELFFAALGDDTVVAELALSNFEINAPPQQLSGMVFGDALRDLRQRWQACHEAAAGLGMTPVAVGILPTVRDDMLQPEWMSKAHRYRALNAELLLRRHGEPLHISVAGSEQLDYRCNHIMLEAACTSLQAHLRVNPADAARFYNAAILAAAPLVAATANSPYLYGKSLWAETRVPAFEQATATDGFRDKEGRRIRRVTLGTGYVRHSLMELFVENLSYPNVLAELSDEPEQLAHLQLQNGTIWRWVRPILGFDEAHRPHLRIEHRVMPAGPSLPDTVANLALCHGLMLGLGQADEPPENSTSFHDARDNFYACAKLGLAAELRWAGKTVAVKDLLLDELLPLARAALARQDIPEAELDACFADVLQPRLHSGRNGAQWQRSFVQAHGRNDQALTERYVELQATDQPVHLWPL